MTSIFPASASAGQQFSFYTFDGEAWNIIESEFITDYLEESTASAIYLDKISASTTYLTQNSASSEYATKTELENIDALPSQTGNSGKYLTTSGSAASWSTIDLTSAINTASAAAVTYLVDSAPETLNTLNELSAALNDDANFASTVTTALGTKAPTESPTFTGTVVVPTLDLTNPLSPQDGGTGLNSLGSAGYVLKVNSGSSALEWGAISGAVYQSSAPSTPQNGDIWIDSDATASVLNTNDFLLKADFELVSIPVGGVTQYAGDTSPSVNYAICDGAAVSRTTYATLFSRIGTTYGAGDSSTTFNLPNLKGRVAVGLDSTQTEFDTLAETGGAKTHTLTSSEMPSHTHIQNAHGHVISANSFAGDLEITMGPIGADGNKYSVSDSGNDASSTTANFYARNTTATNQNTGSDGAHNNLQPYIVMNYLIRII